MRERGASALDVVGERPDALDVLALDHLSRPAVEAETPTSRIAARSISAGSGSAPSGGAP